MANILFETKGGSSPNGKPRVYFTCHPEDFEKYFKKMCEDIFKTHDCAIYYTDDMTEEIEETYKETDLYRMNLFVIPVTFRMLSNPNRAMDSDFVYAKAKGIPVLPLMMESGIDSVYALPDKFGELQYLSPFSTDMTAISYEEKLKKYLESVLISDELAKRVRKAFDAYIFLSYRKKDRHYANELMRIIHKNPEYRDIAIWYDEFLTPGESFKENIAKMLRDSKLFTLLVTPSLLELVDGKPNFVMQHEYPDAKKAGMTILPAEMKETNKRQLRSKYKRIPPCVDPKNEKDFKRNLLKNLKSIANSKNNNDPKHNFLIGLAYLEGIDVEVDRERGLHLITSAAEAGNLEAMEKLYNMYTEGKGIQANYEEAVKWAEQIVEYCRENFGEEDTATLVKIENLGVAYGRQGEYQKAAKTQEQVYALRCKTSGQKHEATINTLSNLAFAYGDLGDYQKALELNQTAYELYYEILGENHPDTLLSLHNLAHIHSNLGNYQKALELNQNTYELRRQILGEDHLDTLQSMNNLAVAYSNLGNAPKALEYHNKVYPLRCQILGENHPDTLTSLNNLAVSYGDLGNHQKALEFNQAAYETRRQILGKNHPDTLSSLNNLAMTHNDLGDHQKALEFNQTAYETRRQIFGKAHPDTLTSLSNLAFTYSKLGDYQKALELHEKTYKLRFETVGENHPDTLTSLNNIAIAYSNLGKQREALFTMEKVYQTTRKVLGKNHPKTAFYQKNLNILKKNFPHFK